MTTFTIPLSYLGFAAGFVLVAGLAFMFRRHRYFGRSVIGLGIISIISLVVYGEVKYFKHREDQTKREWENRKSVDLPGAWRDIYEAMALSDCCATRLAILKKAIELASKNDLPDIPLSGVHTLAELISYGVNGESGGDAARKYNNGFCDCRGASFDEIQRLREMSVAQKFQNR